MNDQIPTQLDPTWKALFEHEFTQNYMVKLQAFLDAEAESGTLIHPPNEQRFNAFLCTPFDEIKVVIIGQDPYHGEGQAHGLSFSVPDGIKIPPSLRNIYKEINRDLGLNTPASGNLESWAKQGVLLLNTSLSVRAGSANSHSKQGWLKFTNACIQQINKQKQGVVFLAWGRFAHNICAVVDTTIHCVIKTSHPSPLGAFKTGKGFDAFIGSGCFSSANDFLKQQGKRPIHWQPRGLEE